MRRAVSSFNPIGLCSTVAFRSKNRLKRCWDAQPRIAQLLCSGNNVLHVFASKNRQTTIPSIFVPITARSLLVWLRGLPQQHNNGPWVHKIRIGAITYASCWHFQYICSSWCVAVSIPCRIYAWRRPIIPSSFCFAALGQQKPWPSKYFEHINWSHDSSRLRPQAWTRIRVSTEVWAFTRGNSLMPTPLWPSGLTRCVLNSPIPMSKRI